MGVKKIKAGKKSKAGYVTKKCPECYAYVKIEAEVCPHCKTKLGAVGSHGMALRKTDWKSYLTFAIALVALAIYLWWAFFRK